MAQNEEKVWYSLVIPLYNEGENIKALFRRSQRVFEDMGKGYEIIFIDDSSTDSTVKILEDMKKKGVKGLKVSYHETRKGQEEAIIRGIKEAKGETIIFMDADLQVIPEDIPRLTRFIDEGHDMVSGWRQRRKDSPLRRAASGTANIVIRYLAKSTLHDHFSGFKAINKDLAMRILRDHAGGRSLFPLLMKHGHSRAEVIITHQRREKGGSHYSWIALMRYFIRCLKQIREDDWDGWDSSYSSDSSNG